MIITNVSDFQHASATIMSFIEKMFGWPMQVSSHITCMLWGTWNQRNSIVFLAKIQNPLDMCLQVQALCSKYKQDTSLNREVSIPKNQNVPDTILYKEPLAQTFVKV